MPDIILYSLIMLGLATIATLTWFIRKQWTLLQKHQTQVKASQAQQAQAKHALIDSLRVLTVCILDDQMELSEGCIRIKVLLDNLAPEWHHSPELSIFSEIYEALSHMPTHETRLKTDKRFVFKMDQQRFRIEKERKEEILAAASALQKRLAALGADSF